MSKKEIWLSLLVAFLVTIVFFNQVAFSGFVPFPGDLLLAEYKPWRTSSYAGYNPGAIPHKAQYPDTIRQLYPWRIFAVNQLKNGQLPLWNPYNFAGQPLLANFQSAALYPGNILFFLFDNLDAWTILIILQPFLASWFTYLYLRKIKAGPIAASFGAISYAYSAFMTVWLEYNTVGHVILYLPLLLFIIEEIRDKSKPLWLWLYAAIVTITFLAGHPQIAIYQLIFVLFYTLIRVKKGAGSIFILTLLGLGMAAIQLIPGFELIVNSARVGHDPNFFFQKILIQPLQLFMLIVPNLFGNPATRTYWPADTYVGKVLSVGLILLFFLPAALRVKHPLKNWLLSSSLIVLIFITANPLTFLLSRVNLPLISSSSPTLASFLLAFSLIVLCSLGIDGWLAERHSLTKLLRRTLEVAAFFALLFAIFGSYSPLPELRLHSAVANRAILQTAAIAAATLLLWAIGLLRKKFLTAAMIGLLLIHTATLYREFHKFNPFVPRDFVYPAHPVLTYLRETAGADRFWGYGTATIEANLATLFQVFSPDGYDPLYPRWYGELLGASKDGKLTRQFDRYTRSDATVVGGFGEKDFVDNQYRRRVLDTIGVRYILDRPENGSTQLTFPQTQFEKIDVDDWRIMQSKTAAPRFFLTTDVRLAQTREEFESIFFDPLFDYKKTVILSESLPATLSGDAGYASLVSYQPNQVVIQTSSAIDTLLFLSDTDYPGWQAYVDNKKTTIYRANWSFRAVLVPKGDHKVHFIYRSPSVKIGSVVSIISIISIISLFALISISISLLPTTKTRSRVNLL